MGSVSIIQLLYTVIQKTITVSRSSSYHLRWRRRWQLQCFALQCLVCFFVFPVFCFSNTISFTKDELLNIRQNAPQNLLPDFDYSEVLLDIVFGGAVSLVNRFRTRRQGHFYIGERWCTDVTVLKMMCCSDLETLFMNCKPFYSTWEICSFILVSVYIPPQAHNSSALQKLADLITDTQQQHPDSVLIILGDFNKANLSRELPKYRQHVTCRTRDNNILDHCYTAIKDAYHSVPQAALGLSDHCFSYRPTGRNLNLLNLY